MGEDVSNTVKRGFDDTFATIVRKIWKNFAQAERMNMMAASTTKKAKGISLAFLLNDCFSCRYFKPANESYSNTSGIQIVPQSFEVNRETGKRPVHRHWPELHERCGIYAGFKWQ